MAVQGRAAPSDEVGGLGGSTSTLPGGVDDPELVGDHRRVHDWPAEAGASSVHHRGAE